VIPIYFQWMASEDRKTIREDARLDAEDARLDAIQAAGIAKSADDRASEWGNFRSNTS